MKLPPTTFPRAVKEQKAVAPGEFCSLPEDGDLMQYIRELLWMRKQIPKEFRKTARIETNSEYGYPGIYWLQAETDEEWCARYQKHLIDEAKRAEYDAARKVNQTTNDYINALHMVKTSAEKLESAKAAMVKAGIPLPDIK